MRQAEIYRKGILAGILTEDGGEYRFSYEPEYLTREDALPISLTLPLHTTEYKYKGSYEQIAKAIV